MIGDASAIPDIITEVVNGGPIAFAALIAILVSALVVPQLKGANGFVRLFGLVIAVFCFLILAAAVFLTEQKYSFGFVGVLEKIGITKTISAPDGLSEKDISLAFQSELARHNCEPGSVDGLYGQQTIRAAILYNVMNAGKCESMSSPPSVSSLNTIAWRDSVFARTQIMKRCEHSICGDPITSNFIRSRPSGCILANPNPIPDEYVTWSGKCDSQGYASGVGEIQWYEKGTRKSSKYSGTVVQGILISGEKVGVSPRGANYIYKGEFLEFQYNGLGTLRYIGGNVVEGRWFRGKIPDAKVIYSKTGNEYDGKLNSAFRRHGVGAFYWAETGEIITANWDEGVAHKGEIQFPQTSRRERYVGDLKSLHPAGEGVTYYDDGRVVRGNWQGHKCSPCYSD